MNNLMATFMLITPALAHAMTAQNSYHIHALAVVALYLAFCGWIFRRHQQKNAQRELLNQQVSMGENKLLIAFASQTGNAEQLAQKTAESLKQAGLTVEIYALSAINTVMLKRFSRALFVVSTTGEGDAPDNAMDFLQQVMLQGSALNDTKLKHLTYAILALGDASYTYFCGFGHRLDAWLQHAHATPLFDIVEVDRSDEGALRHWQYQLSVLAKDSEMADWKTPEYQDWQLAARTLLNSGSAGAPVYHLKLTTQIQGLHWQAGDIAEIGPQNAQTTIDNFLTQLGLDGAVRLRDANITLAEALQHKLLPHDAAGLYALAGMEAEQLLPALNRLPHREYSIASIPQDGGLELVVRQTYYADGRLGIGSGWLTTHATLHQTVAVRIRENAAFHPPTSDIPLILIGNGTGIAGLRAHLKQRASLGQQRNWLIFGERNVVHDFYFKDELEQWRQQGVLTRLNTAFSRDQVARIYVQDVLSTLATDIAQWVNEGAAIYVCGSASGMAPAVHQALQAALGEEVLSALHVDGRYRRDVY